MRTIDFSPLFRHSVGFDRMQRLLDAAGQVDNSGGYPPYNIEQTGDDGYEVTLAVAGFAPENLDITITDKTLVVSGKLNDESVERKFLHRGIAGRAFERRFELADHIEVVGANIENGLLRVALQRRIPESQKPRKVEIAPGSSTTKTIEQKAA